MKMIPKFLSLLICLAILFSCGRFEPDSYDYDADFEEIISDLNFNAGVNERRLDLSQVFIKSDWDSIIVIKPYSQYSNFARLNLRNTSVVKFILTEMEYSDFHYYLLFIKEKQIMAYSKMSNLYRIGFDETMLFPIISNSNGEMAMRQVQLNPAFYQIEKIGK
ncbi:hypothetical protein [Algoriphagus aquimarinus]|uniref:hypothetical protein n=1 Tax=Algoriphagus aquimarinus TaxID=237018 RepID=UPI0030D87EC1